LFLWDVLQLIHEEDYGRFVLSRCGSNGLQQGWKILLEVTVVSEPGLGLKVDTDLDVSKLHLQSSREPGERTQPLFGQISRSGPLTQLEQCQAKLRGEQRW
jgi:hypothetical protein